MSSSSPFTSSQWEELQRQALIYKHIEASAPIPPSLLSSSYAASSPTIYFAPSSCIVSRNVHGSIRLSDGIEDEPGRCRRTDGKKWRCARNAEPDQKYCERHLHRGRPRSRKPVEHTRIQTRCKSTVVVSPNSRVSPGRDLMQVHLSILHSSDQPSYSDWTRNYSESIRHSKFGSTTDYTSNHYEEVPNHDLNDSWCSYLNPDPAEEEMCIHKYHEVKPNAATNTTANSNDASNVSSTDKLSISMGLGGPLGEVFQSSKNC